MSNEYVTIEQLLGQHEIEIPGNGIDQAGIDEIQDKLHAWGFGAIPDDRPLPPNEKEVWHWEWKVAGKGEYVGALPKRIGKLVYQCRGVKLSPQQLSELGNIGAEHSGRHCKYWFDVVDRIDWGRTDFGQPSDCCFWGCHASAKDMILSNGGGAIRFFHGKGYRVAHGFARAWLAPWKDCWIVFNGYGLETLPIARILATHLDHAYYRRIRLANNGCSSGDLWINGSGTAYLVGPQESVLQWDRIDLEWEDSKRLTCDCCSDIIDEGDECHAPGGDTYCEECYEKHVFYCMECEEDSWIEGACRNPDGELICSGCWDEKCSTCSGCTETHWRRDLTKAPGRAHGEDYCKECYSGRYTTCDDCREDYSINDIISCRDGSYYCTECAVNHPEETESIAV